jgi:hypothetical protein
MKGFICQESETNTTMRSSQVSSACNETNANDDAGNVASIGLIRSLAAIHGGRAGEAVGGLMTQLGSSRFSVESQFSSDNMQERKKAPKRRIMVQHASQERGHAG